ncbi:hypothetical protein [Bradyrhizobium symbiodeficiens]|uniref:hypothetical protein n=1 Tax=Bradyrhizobium symbiodeficiens TaxID=1404367 RepID=UPI000BA1B3C2|nr:hypothetical protein [Bradyrhizobium symbiodeficiens]AWM05766.1 hypothetical protein CIT39_04365 [Bradyrhizobium symbiodeficiens]
MTIFAILMQVPQPGLIARIDEEFKNDHLKISDTSFLVSANGTAAEISTRLGIFDAANPNAPPTGNAVVIAMSTYWGRAPTETWGWIKAKLEGPPRV